MRSAIIACTLILISAPLTSAIGQDRYTRRPEKTRFVYVTEKSESASYWPNWKLPNLWPTGLGTRIASGTRSSWFTVKTGTSRAWHSTQYTLAPWTKPKPPSLTGSRGVTSSKANSSKTSTESSSWWPKLDFWNSGEPEDEKLESVKDWQKQSSPAATFDE